MSVTVDLGGSGRSRPSFADLSVNVKILTGIVVAVLVAVIVGVVGLIGLSKANSSAQALYANNVAAGKAVGLIDATLNQGQLDAANQLISADAAAVAQYTQAFAADQQAFDQYVAEYRASGPAGGTAATLADLQAKWQAFVQLATTKLLPYGASNNTLAWQKLRDAEVVPLMTKAGADADALRVAESVDAAKAAKAAASSYKSSRTIAIVVLIVGALAALALGVVVARGLVRSLGRVQAVCEGLAAGDLTRATGLTSRDEPGRMGQALDTALDRLRETVKTIDESASSLSSAAEQMTGVSLQIASSAEEASVQASTVSAAAEGVARSVDTVSAGSEEMGVSIREISQNAAEAAQVAVEAVAITAETSATMNKLGDSSAQIGSVVQVITSIAEQTNLLALNATIEAARAGEAGKGFAVVATEVKDLAQETARATEDIAQRVKTIQADTTGAVIAIDEISRVIARISDFQTTIASAVEEQTATTAEMSRSVTQAAVGTTEIAQNITGVAEASQLTSQGVVQSQQATAELAGMSSRLRELVAGFRY